MPPLSPMILINFLTINTMPMPNNSQRPQVNLTSPRDPTLIYSPNHTTCDEAEYPEILSLHLTAPPN